MIIEKDIQSRICEILTDAGFNVVAGEVQEGFLKPAVFVSVFPADAKLLTCGGATEEITDTVEIKYISALETIEDCINVSEKFKELFLYKPFSINGRNITISEIEFEIEKEVLFTYFDITFIQGTPKNEDYENMDILELGGNV